MKQISDPTPAIPQEFSIPYYQETDDEAYQKITADSLLKSGQRSESLQIYDNLLLTLPVSAFRSKIAHNASEATIQIQDKERYLRECLQSDPLHRKARVKLAKLFQTQNDWIACQIEWTKIEELDPLSEGEKEFKAEADKKALGATVDVLKGWGDKILGKFGMSINDFQTTKNADGTTSIQMNKK
ncbi:Tetratricopeptide repeat protein [Spironucleus salmonicida]|uniref:Tetratricopeptide repeat protein n=1 Tax=Spironucleus salmonicida TaxID=348837 RepID=V6LXD3_9EUKA|nr:Tetratricopeptide repeat protein [Spironucleus salmonicida]|eukprot:EST49205.1 Tetratricopeptide repeat protein [Spironucleus salmonicida]